MTGQAESLTNATVLLYVVINILFSLFFNLFLSSFLGPNSQHMEVPRLEVESELQLPAYTTATATRDPSRVFDPHHSSRQRRNLNPLSEARDRTCNLMVPSRIC